ncbi:hypothetical protein P8917_10095 [Bacillus atrophaeus]|uniref:hypothetical protein n=1 Tax=Bacillus atrophaeus TaxID=1452 RepID=UPI002280F837|nr:hypothetical protein [Bacillus atrophaeus]MCY8497750.1 hypothetical protein [Bacillus atrophaeus]MCY8814945.1 hypothetical protein [Bacillus atrophaeus]MCY8821553.1 hypothetical protein [Bacillus atrophaeus]MCY8830983.1 hypothetical protein [Bacillus atrophaeus]MCY8835242.1 hypothetical protein [Bacillus atrophaeus]
MRMKIIMDEETESELTERSYYLGVSLSSIILLHFVLYSSSSDVKREDFSSFSIEGKRSMQMDIKEYVINKYAEKTRFNNSLYILMSIHLKKAVDKTKKEWENWRSKKKSEMFFSTYSIDQTVLERMQKFKGETGLTFTALANYAALQTIEDQMNLFDSERDKKSQGLQLAKPEIIERIAKECDRKNTNPGNLLGKKLEKTLFSLDF